jgi:molybdopterin adenylyltransferase
MSKAPNQNKRVAVLTVSDGVAAGVREDRSGALACSELQKLGFEVVAREVVPDEKAPIAAFVRAWAGEAELVVTTGGTGLGPRDVTPEAIRPLLEREIPGYGELLRADGWRQTPMAVLSRSLAGTLGSALVICLPGSPKAVEEGLATLAPTLPHALELLAGNTEHR